MSGIFYFLVTFHVYYTFHLDETIIKYIKLKHKAQLFLYLFVKCLLNVSILIDWSMFGSHPQRPPPAHHTPSAQQSNDIHNAPSSQQHNKTWHLSNFDLDGILAISINIVIGLGRLIDPESPHQFWKIGQCSTVTKS